MSSLREDLTEGLETKDRTRKKTRSSGRVKKATAKSSFRASANNKVVEPENVRVMSDTPGTVNSMCEMIVLEEEQESVFDHRVETQSNGVESTEMEGIEEASVGKEGSDEFIKQSIEDEVHVSESKNTLVEVPELEDEPPPNVSSPVVPTVRSGLRLRTSDTSLSAEETSVMPIADPDDDIQEVPVEKAAVDVIEVPDDMDTDNKEADSSQQEIISSTSDEPQHQGPIVLDSGELEKEKEPSEQVTKTTEEPETEMVSEDELPTESSKEPETEAVSDEELPANADLLETEAVSEDELPPDGHKKRKKGDLRPTKAVKDKEGAEKSDDSAICENKKKKRKKNETAKKGEYDPSSPTSEASNDDASPSKKSVKEEKVQSSKPKALPELEKYWKAVKDDSTDFTGWTYLLQYVDQENDVDAAREAYDAFLSHYPYCYGYWRKYADYEKRKNNKAKSEEVFERGLKAIPLSVDLWLHYLNYCKATYPDDEEFIRKQFDNALDACGLEFRSDRLWDSYIKWEAEGKRLQNVTAIYDRVMAVPTQGHTTHFESFQEHVSSAAPNKVLSIDEFLSLRREVKQLLKQYDAGPGSPGEAAPPGDDDAPPGEEPLGAPIVSDEETTALRERVVAIRRKVHKANVAAVGLRWTFEEGIKRPYFHVKPLERCQLKNWRDYIDFEISQGDQKRIIMLFERCLIACALYDDFWMKFVRYLEEQTDDMSDKIRSVYERACTIHHPKKPHLHLQWAIYEEEQKCHEKASEILCNLEKAVPTMILVAFRRISVERRRGNTEGASTLYEHYIANMKNKQVVVALVIKYARYCWKVLEDVNRAIGVLKKAVEKDKDNNPRLYLQLIDMLLQKSPIQETEVIAVMDQFLSKETVEIEQKAAFAQRKVEFLEDFGTDVKNIQKAVHNLQDIVKAVKEKKKKMHEIESKAKQDEGSHVVSVTTGGSKRKSSSSAESSQQNAAASSAYGYNTTTPGYTGGSYTQPYQSGQYPQQPSYTQPPYNQTQYNQSDPNYANYQNWSYGNYNQGWGNYNYY